MRRHLVASAVVSAFCALCASSGCNVGEDKPSACEEDETLCPTSSRQATDIGCDCHCVAGYAGITPTREFDGEVSACLPPALNPKLGSEEERATASALSPTQFNQKAYKYCSDTVAKFMSELIEQQQRPRDLASLCVGPQIKCKCSTTGAQEQTPTCSMPCDDLQCDHDNCQPLLKVGGTIDTTACTCSRVNACGKMTPGSSDAPVCQNRVAAIMKRRAKK